mgnify:CR=1 FL=1
MPFSPFAPLAGFHPSDATVPIALSPGASATDPASGDILGGLDKGPFLKAFEPDFYFDDQTRHVQSAAQHVPAGHVPHGVANERDDVT